MGNVVAHLFKHNLSNAFAAIKFNRISAHIGNAEIQKRLVSRKIQRGIKRQALTNARVTEQHASSQIRWKLNALTRFYKY